LLISSKQSPDNRYQRCTIKANVEAIPPFDIRFYYAILTRLLSTGSSPELTTHGFVTGCAGYSLVWQESAGSQILGLVRRFPGKIHIGSAEMTVSGKLLIETVQVLYGLLSQLELSEYAGQSEIKIFCQQIDNL
jgi:hypothetical protein